MKRRTKNARLHTDQNSEQTGAQRKPPAPKPEQIQKRAYEIFTARGGGPGRELDDWLLAENELKAEIELQTAKSTE
jgi:hypothetical protein